MILYSILLYNYTRPPPPEKQTLIRFVKFDEFLFTLLIAHWPMSGKWFLFHLQRGNVNICQPVYWILLKLRLTQSVVMCLVQFLCVKW